jgi:nucleoside-diphosphate-sugar epimerase
VLGPVLSANFSDSVQVIQRLLTGKLPGIPKLGFNIVDVRDVADLHIRCMTEAQAAGQRFIAAGEFAWMGEIARMLRANLGPDAAKVPTRNLPDLALRLAALVDRDLSAVTPGLGRKHDFSSEKARSVLGWSPRPLRTTVLECAKSLVAVGAT